jgi:hypothetical protein
MTDEELLIAARKIRRNAIRAQRKIYFGHEPCAARAKDPRLDAAMLATEKATADCNTIIDRINEKRGLL